jgi:hypothetical protein
MKLTITISDEDIAGRTEITTQREDGSHIMGVYRIGAGQSLMRGLENVWRVVVQEWRTMNDKKFGRPVDE